MIQNLQLKRVPRNQSLPLSVEQYRLWFLTQLDPTSIHFNINKAFRVKGDLQAELFEKSLNAIVSRHESLRTVFQMRDQEPEQIIRDQLFIPIQRNDLRSMNEFDRETQALSLMNNEILIPFSLETGPLLRVSMYQLADEERILLFTIHHIVADFVSLGKLIHELGFFYATFIQGHNSTLPPLPIQFADYANWQKERMQGETYQKQLKYWKEKLSGDLPVLKMPIDRPRPAVVTHNGARMKMTISAELTAELKEMSRKNGATLFITLLAAYQTLLYRYTGQEDICVGTSITSRNKPELHDLIGLFANTLVLRANLEGEPTFAEVLKQTRKVSFGAFAHQDIPYEKLVEELLQERDMSHNPFFQTMFLHLNASEEEVQTLQGVTIEPFEFEKKPSALELSFTITEQNGILVGFMDYNTDLYDSETIERLLKHFQHLLQAVVNNPHQSILQLPIMDEVEKQQILNKWSGKEAVTPLPKGCIHELFTQQAKKTPDAVAVRFKHHQYTYRELDERSNKVANYLLKLEVDSNQLIGLCMDRSLDMIVGLLGILKAGYAYVPIDPSYPTDRIKFLMQNSKVKVLLTSDSLVNELTHEECKVISLNSEWARIGQESSIEVSSQATPDDLMYVIYTSGSTGTPKGVMVSHKGVVNHCVNIIEKFKLNVKDRVLQFTSVSFDVAVQEIFPTLLSGAALVLWKDKYISEGEEFFKWIDEEKISVLNLTTAHWSNLVSDLKYERAKLPTNLKLVIVGGEKVSHETYMTWKKVTHGNVRWINDYGLTETTITATMFEPDPDWHTEKIVPIGQPLQNTEIYILDAKKQPAPIGVFGELYIGGLGVAKGYWNRPELTEERFVPHLFRDTPGATLYKTGDQARFLPDGNIEFLGRVDHQVKIRGYRIELGEIEAALEQYGKLSQSVVIPYTSNGTTQLAAYVKLSEPAVQMEELKTFLKTKLPDYMVPLHYIVMDEIPLTPNGKVDVAALPKAELYTAKAREYVAPRTSSEEIAVTIWSALLGQAEVSVQDNFFEIGGNSLLATQIVSQAKAQFQCNIPLRILFEYPVLSEWVEQIEQIKMIELTSGAQVDSEKCIVKIQQKGDQLPLFFVHPVGGTITCYFTLARQLGENQPFYAIQGHGMVHEDSTLDTVEDMADHYIKEILEVQPHGPYRLGGWSMGGFIAYEIAKKLKEAGHEVIQLVLVDSYLSRTRDADDETILYNFVRQLAAVPGKSISDSILLSWKNVNLDDESLCIELKALDLLPSGTSTKELRRLINVYKNTVYAFNKYDPAPDYKLDIEHVQLFRAEDSPEEEGVWTNLVNNLSLKHVIADHFSIVHNPDIGKIADIYKTNSFMVKR